MGQQPLSSNKAPADVHKEEFAIVIASSYGCQQQLTYSFQRLYLPSFTKSSVFSLPFQYESSATFLDTEESFVIVGVDSFIRSRQLTLTFLDRNTSTIKAKFPIKAPLASNFLFNAGYDRVVLRLVDNKALLVSPTSNTELQGLPSSLLSLVPVNEAILLVATPTAIIAYDVHTQIATKIADLESITQACFIKVFNSLFCLFDFSQKRAWSVLASAVEGRVRGTVTRILTESVCEFMKNPIKLRSVRRAGDVFYFFCVSGEVPELQVSQISTLYIRLHTAWVLSLLRRQGGGLGKLSINCWREVSKFL
jgi:hypothetical protein